MVAPARSGVASGGELDIPMLLACGSGIYTGLSALLFPLSVMKTRLQARNQPSGVLQEARTIYASAGLGGFFRGLGPVLLGAVPARAAYIAMLEGSKPLSFRAAEALGATGAAAAALCSGVAGFSAVLASQLIYVPVDVVTQRLMVSSDVTLSARRVIRSIVDTSGVAGLYRGFGISMVAYLPGGSVWWGAYGASQAAAEAFSEEIPVVVTQFISATAAACSTVLLTSPLDLLKTRLQLHSGAEAPSFTSAAADLFRREGVIGFYRGSAPRLMHLTVWGGIMVSVYEALKTFCTKPAAAPEVALARLATLKTGLPPPTARP